MTSTLDLVPKDRIVGFFDAFGLFFRNFATFEGRSSRGAFWWWVVWTLLLSLLFGVMDGAFSFNLPVMGGLWLLVTLIPGLALAVRRLHDAGRSGWWLLIGFIPLLGFLVLLFFYAQPGLRGPIRYGDDREAGR